MLSRVDADDEAIAKFKRATAITAKLDHPNIVRVLESGASGAVFYFIMEFCDSGSVWDLMLKNKDTVLFLGVLERINNPGFNSLEFERIRNEAGRNNFSLSAKKWIDLTGAKGLIASAGRYGGTFAHKDIAFGVRLLAQPGVQALSHQGISAPQGR